MPYLTPSTMAGVILRPLYIPRPFLTQVSGALLELTKVYNWESYGDMTPDECVDAMNAMIDQYYEGNPMIGVVLPYASANCPSNMLPCDGSIYARVDYPALFASLDTAFILDADHFVVPDMVDYVPAGAGNTGAVGDKAGTNTVTLTDGQMPRHSHSITKAYGDGVVNGYLGEIPALVITQSVEVTTVAGNDEPHENRQPTIYLSYGIVYQ